MIVLVYIINHINLQMSYKNYLCTNVNFDTKGTQYQVNRIGGVMVSVLASIVIDRGFEPWSGQTKNYKIGICCFSSKYAELRRKSKDWLAHNQDNVSEWGDMSIRELLFSELALYKFD